METKQKKVNKGLMIAVKILAVVLVLEVIFFSYKIISNRLKTSYYTLVNDIIKEEDRYIAVGLSDFKNSKFTKYQKYNKPVIWELDEDYNYVKELPIDLGYNGYFNSIIKIKDGYVAVGALEMSKKEHQEQATEAIIVKYDNELNQVWRKNLKILDVNEFVSIEEDKDGNYIVVGKSLYAENYMGNHTTGGAILLRYNSEGEETLRVNYGGPQKGIFNDVIVEDDGYTVVGVYSTSTGVIKKYSLTGEELWHAYYGHTDSKGITSITKDNDKYYVTATKLKTKDAKEYNTAVISYDKNGNKLNEAQYKKEDITRFEDIYVNDKEILAAGITVIKTKEGISNYGVAVKYDKELNKIESKKLKGDKNTSFIKIYNDENSYTILGNTNSKFNKYKTNGIDYMPIYFEY